MSISSDETESNGRYNEPNYIPKRVVKSYFEKKFQFRKDYEWTIPKPEELFTESYSIESLQDLKNRLNTVKNKLNDYPIEDWSCYTRKRNPAGGIPWKLKQDIEAEFVTFAWCKFYECLNQFPIVTGPKLNTVHFCEAPGAFIAALNHYLQSTYKDNVEWNWLASTLNPYYEGNPLGNMVIDDRFMLHTLDKWCFGEDFTGNIMDLKNIESMAMEIRKLGPIDLVTADGSTDCMETPECQEEVVYSLHYSEICAALRILRDGGSFVIKMFTIFEATALSLMYLLNCIFNEVNVFKPATSKQGNSEIYIICIGFKLNAVNFQESFKIILKRIENNTRIIPIFPLKFIPNDFLIQHEKCARLFMGYQINVINSNIHFYNNKSPQELKRCKLLRFQVGNFYFKYYKIQKIPNIRKILYKRNATIEYSFHTNIYSGSYTERSSLKSDKDKLNLFKIHLDEFKQIILWPYNQKSVEIEKSSNLIDLNLYFGKPILHVTSSLFVHIYVMHLINKIIEIYNKNNIKHEFLTLCQMNSKENPQKYEIIYASNDQNYFLKGNYNQEERDFFSKIINNTINYESSILVFEKVPILTHFSISILWYFWSNIFEEMIFNKDLTITFKKLKDNGLKELMKLSDLTQSKDFNNILCIINIKNLHQNNMYETFCNYNNQLSLFYCETLFNLTSSSIC